MIREGRKLTRLGSAGRSGDVARLGWRLSGDRRLRERFASRGEVVLLVWRVLVHRVLLVLLVSILLLVVFLLVLLVDWCLRVVCIAVCLGMRTIDGGLTVGGDERCILHCRRIGWILVSRSRIMCRRIEELCRLIDDTVLMVEVSRLLVVWIDVLLLLVILLLLLLLLHRLLLVLLFLGVSRCVVGVLVLRFLFRVRLRVLFECRLILVWLYDRRDDWRVAIDAMQRGTARRRGKIVDNANGRR